MNEIITYMLTYGILFAIFLGFVHFISNGFFFTFMRVKASRGKKVLVEVRSKIETYSIIGKIEEGFLIYKDRPAKAEKVEKRIALPEGAVYRKFNLNFISVDEEKNIIFMPDFKGVTGFDAIKLEGLNIRALQKPDILDLNKLIKIVLIVGLVTLLAVLFIGFKVVGIEKLVMVVPDVVAVI